MVLSQFSFIMHSQTLECMSMHSQCILKCWPCYLMEPNKVENHSKIIQKHLGTFSNVCKMFQCFLALSVTFLRERSHFDN